MSAVTVGCAARPMPGEVENGDEIAVIEGAVGLTIAVIDGLGHGPQAAVASRAAAALVRRHAAMDLAALFHLCDHELRGTRGVAMSIVRFQPASGRVSHAGVGNVVVATRAGSSFRGVALPGVVGGRFRKVMVTESVLTAGEMLVVHTDGISRRIDMDGLRSLPAQRAAEEVLARYAKEIDDAACAVVCR